MRAQVSSTDADKLYVIPASHPCVAVEAALKMKGIPYKRVDFLPVVHRLQGKLLYGARRSRA